MVQYKIFADSLEHKVELLKYLLRSEKIVKPIVFVKTRERLQELVQELDKAEIKFAYIRGEMEQEKRIAALERFAGGSVNILLATDVAARGIDVSDVSHVINFDMPRSADIYVHRIGRTARAGKKGVAINLVEAHDVPILGKIERYTGEKITLRVIDGLKAQNKLADFSKKKKKKEDKDVKSDEKEKHIKKRARDLKNKGKPNFYEKKRKKLLSQGITEEEADKLLNISSAK